ncbi:MAG: DUF6036 family nucleotidyltransferase [Mucilaginibacter sp.]
MFDFFKKIIDYFDSRHIPYMLSGSIAMSMYVVARATRDIDFVVHLQPKDVDDFVNYFEGAYYCSKEAVVDAIQRQSMFNVLDHATGYKADFVIRKNSEYRLVEFERKQIIEFYGLKVNIVSQEDLLISKIIWIQQLQSGVQMEDIKNLSLIPDLHWDYINAWIKKLNLNTFNLFR